MEEKEPGYKIQMKKMKFQTSYYRSMAPMVFILRLMVVMMMNLNGTLILTTHNHNLPLGVAWEEVQGKRIGKQRKGNKDRQKYYHIYSYMYHGVIYPCLIRSKK